MTDDFRVRFAPSPTGRLHIGNARTAVLNWLIARRHGGSFILRIEDTDLARSSGESERSILEDLRWLGLDWDEGPDAGGACGPYRQSERGQSYRDAAEKLVSLGRAYYCYLTDTRMEEFRQRRLAEGRSPVYRGELSAREQSDGPDAQPSIRFRVPEGMSAWNDLVKGEVAIDHANIGDFIILRADGRPTYNFAVVADDIEMRISHVIRGDDHLSNTPRQRMLYAALGAPEPFFAHVPMILGPDHQRLSKRHGATSVGEFRTAGFLPEALINYLSLLCWSAADGEEFLPLERLRSEIDLDRLGRSAAVFDMAKLRWLNGRYIRILPEETLVSLLREFAGEEGAAFDDCQFREIALACRESLELLSGIREMLGLFRGEPPAVADPEGLALLGSAETGKVLAALAGELRRQEKPDAEGMRELIKRIGKETGIKGRALFMPVRLALTGSAHGPDLPRIMAVIGAARCADLLDRASGVPLDH
jgi:nondiscriminating glutamyl-tRNA synthetase